MYPLTRKIYKNTLLKIIRNLITFNLWTVLVFCLGKYFFDLLYILTGSVDFFGRETPRKQKLVTKSKQYILAVGFPALRKYILAKFMFSKYIF